MELQAEAVASIKSHEPTSVSYEERLRRMKIKMGRPLSPDNSEKDESDVEEARVVVLHKLFGRRVTLHPGDVVQKCGRSVRLEEAHALRVASAAGLPVPRVYSAETVVTTASSGTEKNCITMSYIPGRPLSEIWPDLAPEEKNDICLQVHAILVNMRAMPAPRGHIGGAEVGDEVRDARILSTYTCAACQDEDAFNAFLLDGLFTQTPPALRRAFESRLHAYTHDDDDKNNKSSKNKKHRIVFTHADLTPRNILVRQGNVVVGLVDWELAGWYPEHWEYVKFFQRAVSTTGDWRQYADVIFGEDQYPNELVDYMALWKWQND